MWTRLELSLRRGARAFAGALGTSAMAWTLLALAGIALWAARAWARSHTTEAAHAFATSFAFEAIALALAVDAAVGLLRAVPGTARPDGSFALGRLTLGDGAHVGVRMGYALVALAFGASLLARDVAVLRIAAGEEATSAPEQIVARDPWRPFSETSPAVRFTVVAVAGPIHARGAASDPAVDVRTPDGALRHLTARRPLWYGWSRLVWPEEVGWALRYEIAVENGAVLDSAIAKVDLSGHAEREAIRSSAVPHRFLFALTSPEKEASDGVPPLDVAVYRGKLRVASGRLDPGRTLPFEGLVVAVPEARRWVQFRVVHDPGLPLGLAGAALALAAALLGRFAPARGSSSRR